MQEYPMINSTNNILDGAVYNTMHWVVFCCKIRMNGWL